MNKAILPMLLTMAAANGYDLNHYFRKPADPYKPDKIKALTNEELKPFLKKKKNKKRRRK